MSINRSDRTFRLAFVRRKIKTAFKSQAVRSALFNELNTRGPDSEMIVKMVERIPTSKPAVVQLVKPTLQPAQPAAEQPIPSQPAIVQPAPAPVADVQHDQAQHAQVQPAPEAAGNSEESALEVLDSEDELVQSMTLSPRREQRLRRQLQLWRERLSSSSD